ncbi:MBL fold metallo-hydrolase [Halorarius halobius]|uniref:MBL fold metallo-hydrolase n=1 Tax=Halorarius halobius TaxID=2962671 RepID=UPI0020CBE5FD|nr:MBL fold metallo-hydrolase [Halorarius halobius]
MAIGDVYGVTTGSVSDTYYLDTGMYDTAEFGAVYVVDAPEPTLVDTGIGANYENTLAALEELGIAPAELSYIVPTHVHLDHAGGAGYLAAECENADVVCHERGAKHLVDPSRLWEGTKRAVGDQFRYYVEPEPVPVRRIRQVRDGSRIDLGDRELVVHDAPGHAPHHAVFHSPADDAVYVADAAGVYVPAIDAVKPTTPPPNFDFEQCLADVRMLRAIGPETLLYTHYGPAPTDDRLSEYVGTLTDWVEAVAAKREELGDDDAVVDHFVAATEMDDVWTERKATAEAAMNSRGVLSYLDDREAE